MLENIEAVFKAYQMKNNQKCKNVDSKGTIIIPCRCKSNSNHDPSNTQCMTSLLDLHKENINALKEKLEVELAKKRALFEKQNRKAKIPDSAEAVKKMIDTIENFLDEKKHTPLILRPNFKKKECVGFLTQYGKSEIKQIQIRMKEII